eukprot:1310907-Rhodomonas_salina.1
MSCRHSTECVPWDAIPQLPQANASDSVRAVCGAVSTLPQLNMHRTPQLLECNVSCLMRAVEHTQHAAHAAVSCITIAVVDSTTSCSNRVHRMLQAKRSTAHYAQRHRSRQYQSGCGSTAEKAVQYQEGYVPRLRGVGAYQETSTLPSLLSEKF